MFHHHQHVSRKTSGAGHRPPPRFPITTGPVLPASNGFLRPSPGRQTILQGPTRTPSSSTQSPLHNFLAPSAIQTASNVTLPPPMPLKSANFTAISVTLVHLHISSFLIRSSRETPSTELSNAERRPAELDSTNNLSQSWTYLAEQAVLSAYI